MKDGRIPAGSVERYAPSTARAMPGSRTARPLTMTTTRREAAPTSPGRSTSPATWTVPCTPSTSTNRAAKSCPHTEATRARNEAAGASTRASRPSEVTRRRSSGRVSARVTSVSAMARHSDRALRRNLRLAGTLWNRSRTSTVVPRRRAAGSTDSTCPPAARTCVPSPSPVAVSSNRRETEQMAGSASPRKP